MSAWWSWSAPGPHKQCWCQRTKCRDDQSKQSEQDESAQQGQPWLPQQCQHTPDPQQWSGGWGSLPGHCCQPSQQPDPSHTWHCHLPRWVSDHVLTSTHSSDPFQQQEDCLDTCPPCPPEPPATPPLDTCESTTVLHHHDHCSTSQLHCCGCWGSPWDQRRSVRRQQHQTPPLRSGLEALGWLTSGCSETLVNMSFHFPVLLSTTLTSMKGFSKYCSKEKGSLMQLKPRSFMVCAILDTGCLSNPLTTCPSICAPYLHTSWLIIKHYHFLPVDTGQLDSVSSAVNNSDSIVQLSSSQWQSLTWVLLQEKFELKELFKPKTKLNNVETVISSFGNILFSTEVISNKFICR